jgi:hypothetical protein
MLHKGDSKDDNDNQNNNKINQNNNKINQPGTDKQNTHTWLGRSNMFPESEGFMFAISGEIIL